MKHMNLIEREEKTFWEDLKSGKFAKVVKEESRGKELTGPHEVFNIVKPIFAENDDVERLYCIFLDTRNRILGIEKVSSGSLASSLIYPREIIKRVIQTKAAGTVLVHNHPSGKTDPSKEDIMVTRKMAIALEAIDVRLHDHIIVGDGYQSMSDNGFMRNFIQEFNRFLSNPSLRNRKE